LSTFPSTAELLVQGHDPRLRLDPHHGANHYLCRPQPDDEILKLGSSTASAISQRGFGIADRMRNAMAEACRYSQPEQVCREHAERICQELRDCLQLHKNTCIALTESGTGTHRLAVRSIQAKHPQRPLRVLMAEASETGSGVPDALCPPPAGPADAHVTCDEIAIRDANGMPLPAAAIDGAVSAQAEQAIGRGEDVLLVMVDQSKSGCVAPSLSCALDVRQRFPGRIHLLLDGCQFRFSVRTLNHYLDHGIMVAITGSKFLAGPSFSGALLLPDCESVTVQAPNPGLLIRWQVALDALRVLSTLDDHKIVKFLEKCGQAIRHRLIQESAFELLTTPAIIRQKTAMPATWDDLPTIFPFRICLASVQGEEPVYASYEEAMVIYRQLQQGDAPRVQLGRPISTGRNRSGTPFGALRLCISTPMLIDAIAHQQQTVIMAQCMFALDRVSEIMDECLLKCI